MTDAVKIMAGRRYRHKKGAVYDVVGVAEHTETRAKLVIYKRVGKDDLYARPMEMFGDGRFVLMPSMTFKSGDRVMRVETGERGVIMNQFVDGYVSMVFDDGRPAELDASSLVPEKR